MGDSTNDFPVIDHTPVSGGGLGSREFTTSGMGINGVSLVSVPPQALKVLRLAGLSTIGTIEVAKLAKALYPLWAWNDNPLWEEPAVMLDYRQVLRSSAEYFTPVFPFHKQYVISLIKNQVIGVWAFDDTWREVSQGNEHYPDSHTVESAISSLYELGLNAGAVRVGASTKGSVILHVSPVTGIDTVDDVLINVTKTSGPLEAGGEITIGLDTTLAVLEASTHKRIAWKFKGNEPTPDRQYEVSIKPGNREHIFDGIKNGISMASDLVPYKNLAITNLYSNVPMKIIFPDGELSWELSRAFDNYISLPLKALGYSGRYAINENDGLHYRGVSQRVYELPNLVPLTPEWLGCIYELARLVMENLGRLHCTIRDDYGLTVAYHQGQGTKLVYEAKRLLTEICDLAIDDKTKKALEPLLNGINNSSPDEPLDLREAWGIERVEGHWLPETVSATQAILLDWRVSVGDKVWLTYGKRFVEANISLTPSSGTKEEVEVSSSLLEKLGVPETWQLKPRITDEFRDGLPILQVGPVFGILVKKDPNKFGPYNWRTSLCKDLIKRSKRHNALMVAFSPEDIDFENDEVHGYIPEPGGIWKRLTVPFPQAVYDRYISATWDEGRGLVGVRERLQEKGVVFYNTPSFAAFSGNKLIVASKLLNIKMLSSHIPNAWPLKEKNLALALDENPETGVIIKPVFGTQGSGIMIVEPNLSVHIRSNNFRYSKVTFGSFHEMYSYITGKANNKQMLIQPYISTIKYKERSFALRVLMQKSSIGKWFINEAQANVEPVGGLVVDLYSMPVHLDKFARLLSQGNGALEGLDTKVKALAYTLVQELDSVAGGCNELGVDFVVDTSGHLWILEINSKPWGPERSLPDFRYKRRLWLNRIVRRLKVMTGFTN